jgi:DNA-binding response OmpR family regulator
MTLGALEIDHARGCVVVRGRVVPLRPLDLRVLEQLARTPQRVVSRESIAETLWGPATTRDQRAVDVCVARLRRALGDAGRAIVTVRRVGYRFDSERLEEGDA